MNKNRVVALFDKLGFSRNEAAIYIAALEIGSASVQKIATRSQIHRVVAYQLIETLVERGLLEVEPKRYGKKIAAVSPERLVGISIDHEETYHKITAELEQALPELLAQYHTGTHPRVRYLHGVEGFKELMREIEETKQPYDHLGASEKPLVELLGEKVIREAVARKDAFGIRRRVLVTREPWTIQQIENAPKKLREYRFLPRGIEVPTRLYLYDKYAVAFVSLEPEIIVVVIEDMGIFKIQELLFEALWKESEPVEER